MKHKQEVLDHQIFQMETHKEESDNKSYKFVFIKVNRIFSAEDEERGQKFLIQIIDMSD